MNILQCENVTKTYKMGQTTVTALDGVDLAVEKGEFVAVVGASGSGKSTLLHMLGGVDRPTSGTIKIEDTDISTLSEKQLSVFRRRKVGLIYQFYNLIPTLDVRQNILLPVLLDGRSRMRKASVSLRIHWGLPTASTICPRSCPAASSSAPP